MMIWRLNISHECLGLSHVGPIISYNLIEPVSCRLHFALGFLTFFHSVSHTFLLPSCLSSWWLPGWPQTYPSFFPLSLFLKPVCLPATPIPLLPHYWLFSFLLDQSNALGREGEPATHLSIVKQMWQKQKQCIFIRLNKYSFPQQMYATEINEGCNLTPCREVNDEILLTIKYFRITEFIYSKTEDIVWKPNIFKFFWKQRKKMKLRNSLVFIRSKLFLLSKILIFKLKIKERERKVNSETF